MTFLGNLKIGAKIAISIALLSVMALAIAGIAIQMMSSYQSKIAAVRQASVEALIAQRINGDILAAVMESRGIFMAVEDPAFLRQFADGLEKTLVQMTQRVAQLRAANGGGDAKEIDAIAAAADRFAAQRRELIQVGLASGAKASMELGYSGPNKESRVALSKAVESFADENQKEIESLEAGLEHFRATRLAWLIALATGGIGLSIAIAIAIVIGSITRPLSRMGGAMRAVSEGDFNVEIPAIGRRDEIGQFAAALAVFKEAIAEKMRLREAQVEAQAAAMRRQEEVDQLVGLFGMSMSGVFHTISSASAEMSQSSSFLEISAGETSGEADRVMTEAEHSAASAQTVAAASQQLSASITGIGRQVSRSSRIADAALQQARTAVDTVSELRAAAESIGTVLELINRIAGQTNLLALNATIEAARAGEAGKGFAVVASEVKSLARQTSAATDDIRAQIAAVHAATMAASEAFDAINNTVGEMNEIATGIADSVEEQSAATQEIARSIEQVSTSTGNVTASITQVRGAATRSGETALVVKSTAKALSSETDILSSEVKDFIAALKNIAMDNNFRVHAVDLPATAMHDGESIAGRVTSLSTGIVVFAGKLSAAPGSQLELRIDGIDRDLKLRFVNAGDDGVYLQLPLSHAHMTFMEQAIDRLIKKAA
jgi:methyl-accepting chemotaxis protein